MELRQRWVQFRIRDVYLPHPSEVLAARYEDEILGGRVLDLSEAGRAVYVVVDVEGLSQPLIVDSARLLKVV